MASKMMGLTVEIGGDTTKLSKALKQPNIEAKELQAKLKAVNAALKLDPSNVDLLAQKQRLLGESLQSNEKKLKLLKEAQNQFISSGKNIDSAEYIDLQKNIVQTESKIKSLKNEQDAFSASVQAAGKKFDEFGTKAEAAGKKSAKVSATNTAALGLSVKAAVDWETAWTGVLKTVNGTEEQLALLEQGIKDLAKTTNSSKGEIAGVAEAAGQLGIATDDILSFTETMIMLGDTTNLSANDAATALAKFANITKTSPKDYGRLGSSIVELGNNFATTERDIVEMSTRLASTGELAGLSEADILGLATSLSSVGIEAEAGGSAFSKLLKEIQLAVELGGDSLYDFASVAGLSAEQFQTAFREDAAGAVAEFITGLNNTERNGKSAIAVLDEMGFTEVRLSNSILSLANNSDLLNNALNTSSSAWEDNTALQDEAQKRYDTVAAKLTQLKEVFSELAITVGEILMPVIEGVTSGLKSFVEWLNGLNPIIQTIIVAIMSFLAALAPVLIIIGKVSQGIGGIIKLGEKLSPVFESIGKFASSAFGLLKTVALGAFKAISAHPIVALLTIIIGAIVLLYNKCEWFREMVNSIIQKVISFFQQLVTSIITFFTVTIPQKISEFVAFFQSIPDRVMEVINAIIAWFESLPYKIGYAIGTLIAKIIQFGLDIWSFATNDIPAFINKVVEWFASLPEKIKTWLSNTWERIKEWGNNIYETAIEAIKKTVGGIVEWFKEMPGKVWDWLCDCANKVKQWGHDLYEKGKNAAKELVDSIVEGVKSLPKKMAEIGKNLVRGLWDGIVGVKDWILGKVKSFTDGITDGIKDFFGIHSPSKVMADEVGKYISAGIGEGVISNEDLALSPLEKLAKKMSSVNLKNDFSSSISKTLSSQNTIVLNTTVVSKLNGKVIAEDTIQRITKTQGNTLRFMGV